jgi:hypothetical protein
MGLVGSDFLGGLLTRLLVYYLFGGCLGLFVICRGDFVGDMGIVALVFIVVDDRDGVLVYGKVSDIVLGAFLYKDNLEINFLIIYLGRSVGRDFGKIKSLGVCAVSLRYAYFTPSLQPSLSRSAASTL